MARRSDLRITKRTVDSLAVEDKEAVFWDHDLPGFGVRVYTTGRKVYVVQSRGLKGLKRVTIGRHGDIAAERARKEAAVTIDRIKRGEDPVPAPPKAELTVAGLAERYMRAHVAVQCKPSTAGIYLGVLDNHILPELGGLPVGAVGARACRCPALQAPRHAPCGERGDQDSLQDVPVGRGLGPGAGREESVPFSAPLQGTGTRAFPDGGGSPSAWPGAGRGGGRRRGLGAGGGGDPAC